MANNEVFKTPDERLTELSDSLLASVLNSDDLSVQNRRYLFGQFVPSVFRNENYIIYRVLHSFKDKGITPDEEFMKLYLTRNIKVITDSKSYISMAEFKDLDDNPELAYISAVLKKYTRLRGLGVFDFDTLRLDIEKYKQEFSAFEMNVAYSQARQILYDGLQLGRKFLQGYVDSQSFIKKRMADIDAVLNKETGAGFIDSRTEAIEENDERGTKPEKIGDFDLITELNKQLGGIYSSMFYNIIAPTKGGKSKFTSRMAHTVMVQYGNNISVWAHEGGYKAWWAQLRAIHFEYLYIRNKPEGERVAPVSQYDILMDKYPSEQIKIMERESMLDLFTNPEYGSVNMIDRPFLAETVVDEINTSVKLNNSKMVLIDYLQLISSNTVGKSKPQYIGDTYQALLSYAKKMNVAIVSPAQFKQEFMDEMAKSSGNHEIRAAGGESSEIIRTPDINIALYGTVDDLYRKELTLMSVPSRMSVPFPDIKIYADLCSCVFASMEDDDEE